MNVSVGKDLEEYARSKVASGDYASLSEVVRDALRLLKEKDRLLEAKLEAMRSPAPEEAPRPATEQETDDDDVQWVRRQVE